MLSLHTGYDTAYLTDAVGNGTAATDYYTAAAGEPPGYWQGAGARALGLAGQVDAEVMRRLYHEDVGPDGQVLVRRQKPGSTRRRAARCTSGSTPPWPRRWPRWAGSRPRRRSGPSG